MKRFSMLISVVPLLLSAFSINASPKIDFDTKTFHYGIAVEGKTEKLNAVFNIKNTGDAVLRLGEVKPGCGCTVVKFDSLIQPGKSSKIEATVNIKGYHSGPISKIITVISNAKNDPSVRLTIEATIQVLIDLSESSLNLDATRPNSSTVLFLSSKKADLKVNDLQFRGNETNSETPGWKETLPLELKYKMFPADSTRADGYKVYKMEIFSPNVDNTENGQTTIYTNHPDKKEIVITTYIAK